MPQTVKPNARRHCPTRILPLLVLGAAFAGPAVAQDKTPPLLPGGASSLSETHGDWTVQCRVVAQDKTLQRICAVSQRQTDAQGRQVLAAELLPAQDGVGGTLVLPFGLAVIEPVTLAVDDGRPVTARFSTCVPAGCLVPVAADKTMLVTLRSGKALVVSAADLDGRKLDLSLSLQGLPSALDRITQLTR